MTISGLTISLIGLSFGSPLKDFGLKFHLQGIGIAYQSGPLEIGGGFQVIDPPPTGIKYQFDGDAVIKAADFSLAALGSYAVMDNGQASMFVFAHLDRAFGGPPAFFVTGLSAGFGYNRTVKIPAQDEVLDFPLLLLGQEGETQPTPAEILEILEGKKSNTRGVKKAWITPYAGEYWLAAGIDFTSFELVKSRALLIGKFGKEFELTLLGLSSMRLPQEGDVIYAYAELELEADWKPAEGFFGLTAVLSRNSYVITPACRLTGGFAFYIWYKGDKEGQFVLTLGGYHPQFIPPLYFPREPRLSFNWPVSDTVTIKGNAYFALTPSCVMAGGGLEVRYHSGNLQAWFTAQADVLISWKPFHYLAHIAVSIGASYRLHLLFVTVTLSIELGASLDLWGPPTGGKVHIHWTIISFTVGFGASEEETACEPLKWGDFKSLLPKTEDICKILAHDGLTKKLDNGEWVIRADDFAFSTEAAVPSRSLVYRAEKPGHIEEARPEINIRLMNKTNVDSQHELRIFKNGSRDPIDVSDWDLQPISRSMPASLWGKPQVHEGKLANPGTPSSETIPDLPVGIRVQPPRPKLGDSAGEIKLKTLAYEPITPDGQMPLSHDVTAAKDHLPSFNPQTISDIKNMMDKKTRRDNIYSILKEIKVYEGKNGSLSHLAKSAGHLYADAPLEV